MGEQMTLRATTSQTVGPYFQIGLANFYVDDLTAPGVPGERIEIEGRVLDGDGGPIPDAVIEIWQADAQGTYPPEPDARETEEEIPNKDRKQSEKLAFRGYGRVPTGIDGTFHFKTIKPGRVPAPDGTLQAPHITISVFMRGLLRRLVTRIYFPDDEANVKDFALKLVEPARRGTLIAKQSVKQAGLLEWNVVMQGPSETVFFDV
jgi:protocatechuate 3,4-dioxygenase, alpha subunit